MSDGSGRNGRKHGLVSVVFGGCGVMVWVFVGWCSGANWSLEQNGPTRLLVSGAKGSPELCVLGVVLFDVGRL